VFRKGNCTIINTSIAQQIIRKRHEFNLETHIAFIRIEKHLIKQIAITCGTSSVNSAFQPTLQSPRNVYIRITHTHTHIIGKISEEISKNPEVRQGYSLLPTL
jgi:hypothetical protein